MSYDSAGSIASKSNLGAYTCLLVTANNPHAPTQVGTHSFTNDANGNMLTGLNAKAMTYDGENRPVSVSYLGDTTCYSYGPDGKRLIKNVTSSGQSLFTGALKMWGYGTASMH